MNKLSFLRKLKELKIKHVLLSDNNYGNLKRTQRSNLYINKYEKLKFEKFIKKRLQEENRKT